MESKTFCCVSTQQSPHDGWTYPKITLINNLCSQQSALSIDRRIMLNWRQSSECWAFLCSFVFAQSLSFFFLGRENMFFISTETGYARQWIWRMSLFVCSRNNTLGFFFHSFRFFSVAICIIPLFSGWQYWTHISRTSTFEPMLVSSAISWDWINSSGRVGVERPWPDRTTGHGCWLSPITTLQWRKSEHSLLSIRAPLSSGKRMSQQNGEDNIFRMV